jgi:putative transposase
VHIDLLDLRRVYALVFLEHGARRLRIAGVTAHPTGPWAVQQARNLAAQLGVRVDSLRFLIRDRDGKYTGSFDGVFAADDIEVVNRTAGSSDERPLRTGHRNPAARSPRPPAEWNEIHARKVLDAYARHYNRHRPHQARRQLPPLAQEHPTPITAPPAARLLRTRVLGGVINEYGYAA